MALTKPPVIPVWAEFGDKVQPSDTEIQTGWPLSNVPPSRQRFNWIKNYLANGVRYLTRRGIPDWDAEEVYEIDDRVQGPDGLTYKAVTQNTNKTPAANPLDWVRWGFIATELNQLGVRALAAGANTLTAADIGKLVYYAEITGAASAALPALASVPVGSVIRFKVTAPYSLTVNRTSNDQISANGILINNVVMQAGDDLTLVKVNPTVWFAWGSAVRGYEPSFSSLLTVPSGYFFQRLPGGFIIQGGQSTGSVDGTPVTFPIAYTTGCYIGVTDSFLGTLSTDTINGMAGHGPRLLTGFTMYVNGVADWFSFGI